jgi:hypothetical protein
MALTPSKKGTAAMTIVDTISAYISKYVKVGDDELRAISLWVLHTWAFSGNYTTPLTTPYLYIFSAERRSGKTRLLEVLETVIRNPVRAADVTSAVLFRLVETVNPTILLDEVDAIWSGAKNEELRGVLNAGYKRGGKVYRVVNQEPTPFNVFGPKALAGIDNAMLPDTVRDRCIPIHMHRQPVGESVPFYSYDVDEDAERLIVAINEWMDANYERLAQSQRPAAIDGLSDRAWEITMPLVQLATVFGAKYARETRDALRRLLTTEEKLSPQAQLLADIRDAFDEAGTKVIPTNIIIEKLNNSGSGSWNGKLLASRLRPYDVQPTVIRLGNKVDRGYRRMDFEPVWAVYLP